LRSSGSVELACGNTQEDKQMKTFAWDSHPQAIEAAVARRDYNWDATHHAAKRARFAGSFSYWLRIVAHEGIFAFLEDLYAIMAEMEVVSSIRFSQLAVAGIVSAATSFEYSAGFPPDM